MIPIDKIKHFIAGYLISAIIVAIYPSIAGVFTALFMGFIAGLIWETLQKFNIIHGIPSIKDAYATMIGTIAGVLPVLLMIIL